MTTRESVPSATARAPGDSPAAARRAAAVRRGAMFAIAAGVAYGTLGIFGTLFYDEGGERFTLLVVRFWGGGLLLVAIALARRRPRPVRRDALLAMLAGLMQLAATFCLFAGYQNASPGLVTLLFYVYPLLVTLGDQTFFGVALGRRRALLLALGMTGITLTVGVPGSASAAAVLWGLGAGAFTSLFILAGRHVMSRSVDSFQFVAFAFAGAALALFFVGAVVGMSRPPAGALPFAGCLVVFSTVVPVLLFYSAVRLAGAGTAARLATVEPVTAVVLSFVVLGDSLALVQIAGGGVVLLSVWLLAKS